MNSIDENLLKRLRRKRYVTEEEATSLAKKFDGCQGDLFHQLLPLGIINDRDLAKSYAKVCGLPFLDIRKVSPEGEILRMLDEKKSHKYQAIPVGYAEKKLIVAITDASDVIALDRLRLEFKEKVQFVVTLPAAMDELLTQLNRLRASQVNKKIDSSEVNADTESDTHNIDSRDTVMDRKALSDKKTRLENKNITDEEDSFHEKKTMFDSDPHEEETIHSQETVFEEEARQSRMEISTRFSLTSQAPKPLESAEKISASKSILDELVPKAITNRADEIEIDFSRIQCLVSMHLDGYWSQMAELSRSDCSQLVNEIRQRINESDLDAEGNCKLAKMEFESSRVFHRFLVTIFAIEDKTHVRILIPSNVNIIQRPIRLIAQGDAVKKIQALLDGKEKGLLLFSSRDEMVCWQMQNSILFQQTISGSDSTSQKPEVISWRVSLNIPKLNESVARDEADLNRLLSAIIERDEQSQNDADSKPEKRNSILVGYHSPSQNCLEALIPALKTRSALTSLTARQPESALAIVNKLNIPDELKETPLIHIHLWREPKICANCVELLEDVPNDLPKDFQSIDAHEFYEASGCSECGHSGRKGNNWIAQVTETTLGNPDQSKTLIEAKDAAVALVKSAQVDIQDLVDDPYFFPI